MRLYQYQQSKISFCNNASILSREVSNPSTAVKKDEMGQNSPFPIVRGSTPRGPMRISSATSKEY